MTEYEQFLERKRKSAPAVGFYVAESEIHERLFPFQRRITQWALQRGRAAVFADTGLGKTSVQLEWARHIHERTGGDVLILAPLAVSCQTAREGAKMNIAVTVCRTARDLASGLNITNYDRLHHFTDHEFAALVIDESSCIKAYEGAFRHQVTEFAQRIPYRLACTATPAPNDLLELGTHAAFLDVMSAKEMAALFFKNTGNGAGSKWRLKGHAKAEFYKWLASWCVAVRRPSDLGYEDDGFILPPLITIPLRVECDRAAEGQLFPVEARGFHEVRAAMRTSLDLRVQSVAERVNADREPWIVWCNLNSESEALRRAIPDAIEVRGSDLAEKKEESLVAFSEGKVRVIVSKASICGWGMNWQHCARVAFVGLSYSWEQYYQAVRRCWRFGQTRPVECYVATSNLEGEVVAAIQRKEEQATGMMDELVSSMRDLQAGAQERQEMHYREDVASGADWKLYLGDSVERIDEVESNSVGLALFSPPFPTMYAYTNSARDMGNVQSIEEMIEQFRFLIAKEKLLRVLMPGRLCCIHLQQAMTFKWQEGYVGLKDFRGATIQAMVDAGWIYTGEVCIEKNPQSKAARTKDRGLLFKTLATDSSLMTMALADYLLYFRKSGENPRPIKAGISKKYSNPDGWITNE